VAAVNVTPKGLKKPFYTRGWFAPTVIGAVVLLFIVGSVAGGTSKKKNASSSTSSTSTSAKASKSASGSSDDDEENLNAPGLPTVAGAVVAPGSGSDAGPSGCRNGDPLANVYHPNRLKVVQTCTTVAGTVKSVHSEDDGDVHFDLALDSPYTHLLTSANMSEQHGWLVVEIVPADRPGCTPGQPPKPASGTYNYGMCTGADESAPSIGSHVYVTGPYVLDEDHQGWAEIHPAWAISSSLGSTTTTSTLAPPTTTTTSPPPTSPPVVAAPPPAPEPEPQPTTPPTSPPPAPAGCYPKTSSGNCYEAGEYCPSADHGVSGVAGDGEPIQCVDNNGWRWEPA